VSGGADSALALLGAAATLDRMGTTREDLVAVVMPGFGSTDDSQRRAIELAKAVGATVRVVDIRESCSRHLADIGHPSEVHDLAYENVQARERTQVLMDMANMENALVVGTGDLSEIALGWNTYNGDHMSMYQINASVPKTMVLAALRHIAKESEEPIKTVLAGIASAPITPELLPGAAANDSEARLGPYELHDFFLFHYLADGASADKLRRLARIAFGGEYPEEVIGGTLAKFLKRFKSAQYKRNCVPDGPKITLSLSPRADWRMPSDR
jgi:NAD+ synthase (glutamine-hydrolysing)